MTNLLKKLPFYDSRWFEFLFFLVKNFIEDKCQQKAASLTYTTLLSIVPILTVMLVMLSSIPALSEVREQIYNMVYSNLMPSSSFQVSQYINSFAEKSSNLTAIGVLILFVTTIMTLTTIETAFNEIWRVEDRSGGLKSVIRYWTIITLGPLVLGTAFIVSSTVQSLSFLNQQFMGYGIDWSFWVQLVSFLITIAGFVGMYWFIPKANVPIKHAAIAGGIVAILFEGLKQVFGTAMTNFTSYEAVYGAFAALPVFLLWIHLSWNIILLGVEISYTLTVFDSDEVNPRHPFFSLLDMLNLVFKNHQVGKSTPEKQLRNILGRKELPKWYQYINLLKDNDLIANTDKGDYLLKKDLSQISLWQLYQNLPYALPIKGEIAKMQPFDHDSWLGLIANRFQHSQQLVKEQMNISLLSLFENSQMRESAQDNLIDDADDVDDINNLDKNDKKTDKIDESRVRHSFAHQSAHHTTHQEHSTHQAHTHPANDHSTHQKTNHHAHAIDVKNGDAQNGDVQNSHIRNGYSDTFEANPENIRANIDASNAKTTMMGQLIERMKAGVKSISKRKSADSADKNTAIITDSNKPSADEQRSE